jgi:hypothetical protein
MEGTEVREELAKVCGQRKSFQGVFVRFGRKPGYKGSETTILLTHICDIASRKLVTDHVWLTMGKQLQKLDLKVGDILRFDARVTEYLKGYQGRRDEDDYDCKPVESDFRLSFPSKLRKIVLEKDNLKTFLVSKT